MGLDFQNPIMLFGALLLAVPLIIHLLNRRRYQRKPWAAMSFLLQAFKKRRRRLRLENFLLLFLRCLIVVLLAGAMARPFVPSDSPLAALSADRRNVVAVVDRSYSMGYRRGPEETCFEAALAAVKNLVQSLDSGRGDTAAVVMLGDEPEFLVPLNSIPEDAIVTLENDRAAPWLREPSQGGASLSALAGLLAGDIADAAGGGVEVFIFTDMQARLFESAGSAASAGGGAGAPGMAALLKKAVDRGAAIRFVDVSGTDETRPNLGVTDLAALSPNITVRQAATFSATVANFGDEPRSGVVGSFLLDGKVAESRTLDVPPRGRTTVELTRGFEEPGCRVVSFRLEEDELPQDDEWFYAVEARESIDVLLVDGAFSYDPFERPTGVIEMMLNPSGINFGGPEDPGSGVSPGALFDPEPVDFKLFNAGRAPAGEYDCVILANVEGVAEDAAESLFNFATGGGALILFMGEKVDIRSYNLRLYENAAARVLPAPLGSVIGTDGERAGTSFYKLTADSFDHPILRLFADPKLKVLLEVPVFRFVSVDPAALAAEGESRAGAEAGRAGSAPQVVAWFADPLGNRFPAIVEWRVGRGRVMLFTTSADASWTLIPMSPKTYLPLIHETLQYMTTPDPGFYNLSVGETIDRSVPEFPDRVALAMPDGATNVVTEPVEQREHGRYVLPLANHPLDKAGGYVLSVDVSVSGRQIRECYAANVDPLEGDLAKMEAFRLEQLFPGLGITVTDELNGGDEAPRETAGGELWKALLWALLGLVALELILSWKFGDYS